MRRHPQQQTLKRYADGEVERGTGDEVRRHLEECHACRAQVQWHRWLSATVGRLETPAPRADIIAQVVAERARGERLILPTASAWQLARPVRWRFAAAAAAVLVVGVAGLMGWPGPHSTDRSTANMEACMRRSELQGLVTGMLGFIATACAQEPTAASFDDAPRETLRFTLTKVVSGTPALEAGTWTYQRVRQTPSGQRVDRVEQFTLTKVVSGNREEWKSVSAWQALSADGAPTFADTVYFAGDTFRPVRQSSFYARGLKSGQSSQLVFTDDSIVGFLGLEPNRSPVRMHLPDGRYPLVPSYHGASIAHLVRLLPLSAGWTGAIRLAPVGPDGIRTVALKVIGEETTTVPAGVYDCWVLEGHDPKGSRTRWWVSKEERLLVRTALLPEGGPEWVLRSHEVHPD